MLYCILRVGGGGGIIVTMIPLKGSRNHSCGEFFLSFFSAVSHEVHHRTDHSVHSETSKISMI